MTNVRRVFCALLVAAGLTGLLLPAVAAQGADDTVYVATIDGTVDLGMTPYVKRVLAMAEADGGSATLLDINTPGGRLDAALAIKDALLDAQSPVIAYVNREAFSAGALIAISADRIYMDAGGVMGAATPVDGAGDAASEKVVSAVRTDFKAVAEVRGRDPRIAEAMVDESVAVEGLVEKGKLLTLTTSEAIEWGYAEGEAATVDDVLAAEGLAGATLVRVDYSLAEGLVRFLTNPIVASMLISLGGLGLLAEITSPGFGVPGIAGLTLFALFFWGHMLAGLTGWEGVALVAAGLALIAVEVFLTPGFGVAGLLGLVAFLGGLYLSLVGQGAAGADFLRAGLVLGAAVAVMAVAGVAIVTQLPNRRSWGGLSLQTALAPGSGQGAPAAAERAVPGTEAPHVSLVGARGVALTQLHPTGTARIDMRRVDVVSEGGFIEAGVDVVVIADEEYRRVVRAVDSRDDAPPAPAADDAPSP